VIGLTNAGLVRNSSKEEHHGLNGEIDDGSQASRSPSQKILADEGFSGTNLNLNSNTNMEQLNDNLDFKNKINDLEKQGLLELVQPPPEVLTNHERVREMEGKIDPLVEGDLDRTDLENVSDNKTYMLTNSDIDSELAGESKKELFDPETIILSRIGKNVVTSLFWEEKFVMIIRYL
jgi:hypothetical protein